MYEYYFYTNKMNDKVIDINEAKVKKYIESIRPKDPEIRKQVDMGYSFNGKVFELFEIRPNWLNSEILEHIPFAKIRYYKTKKLWKLYWMLSDESWQLYEPFPESTNLDDIIEVIKKDKHHCFFG